MDCCLNGIFGTLAGERLSVLVLAHFTFIYSGNLCKLADIDPIKIIEERLKIISVFYYQLSVYLGERNGRTCVVAP